jgi:hypothetical protein
MRSARVLASSPPSAQPLPFSPPPRLALALLIGAALVHALPHPAGVSPIGAMALFGGACFASRAGGVAISLGAIVLAGALRAAVGDFGGFHALLPVVAGSWALNVAIGWTLRRSRSAARVAAASAAGAVLFFAITNFAVWAQLETYPHTAAGLVACYAAGLPLLARGLAGDLAYAAALFGALAFAQRRSHGLAARAAAGAIRA